MSYEICETVAVKSTVSEHNPTGFIVINKSDFVEGEHELYTEKPEVEKTTKPVVEQEKAEATASGIPKTVEEPVAPWAKT